MILQLVLVSVFCWMARGSDIPCTPEKNVAHPIDCRAFYHCDADSKPHLLRCPMDQHFNQQTEKCDEPANANCVVDTSLNDTEKEHKNDTTPPEEVTKEDVEELPVFVKHDDAPVHWDSSVETMIKKAENDATTDTDNKEEGGDERKYVTNGNMFNNEGPVEQTKLKTNVDQLPTADVGGETRPETAGADLSNVENKKESGAEPIVEDIRSAEDKEKIKSIELGSEEIKHEHEDEKTQDVKDHEEEILVKSDEGSKGTKMFNLKSSDLKKILGKLPMLKKIGTPLEQTYRTQLEIETDVKPEIKGIVKRDTSEVETVPSQEESKIEEDIKTTSEVSNENSKDVDENIEDEVTTEQQHGEENETLGAILQPDEQLNATQESTEERQDLPRFPFFYPIQLPFVKKENETDKTVDYMYGYKKDEAEPTPGHGHMDHDDLHEHEGDDDEKHTIDHGPEVGAQNEGGQLAQDGLNANHNVTLGDDHDGEHKTSDDHEHGVHEDHEQGDNLEYGLPEEVQEQEDANDDEKQINEKSSERAVTINIEDSAHTTNGPVSENTS